MINGKKEDIYVVGRLRMKKCFLYLKTMGERPTDWTLKICNAFRLKKK